jgi:hypothetical protein
MTGTAQTLVVHHHDPMRVDFQTVPVPPLGPSEILLRVDKFGLTSNNVTYAALGKKLRYFEFFPVSADWSALPVWGVGTVIGSTASDVSEGTRVYGYFPAATHATLAVAGATATGFRVRRNLPPEYGFYDLYSDASKDPLYLPEQEDMMVVMRPLFLTGVLLADYLAVSDFMGAGAVLVSSAASKTAYGMAAALQQGRTARVVGLASSASKGIAASMGVYDAVLTYDELRKLPPSEPVVYVDIAGSRSIRDKLAKHLGGALKLALGVGFTHWKDRDLGEPSVDTAVRSETFFAPGWVARRSRELGPAFSAKIATAWQAQMARVDRAFKVVTKTGAQAVRESFQALTEGRAQPDEAWVHSL